MSELNATPLLGRVAVHLKMITMDQLAAATREQGRIGPGAPNLGQILVAMQFIDEAQLRTLVQAQKQLVAKHRARKAAEQAQPGPESGAAEAAMTPDPGVPVQESPARPPAQTSGPTAQEQPPAVASDEVHSGEFQMPAGADPALLAALDEALQHDASDIHFHAGVPVFWRVHGLFYAAGADSQATAVVDRMVRSILDKDQRDAFDRDGELDLAVTLPGVGRFRVNAYRQQRGTDAIFRALPSEPPSLEALGLPRSIAKLTNYHQGMVLITGPAGCGKSSTLAALVDIINEERTDHILTIEDPIEVLHPSKRCVVNQRDVGRHTESFARALRAALREDPDVIVIGELRDFETISLALTAAETGHLVLGTLHTDSAIRTINRLVGVFPADQQEQVRNMLSESLRSVVSQRLVPTADGDRRVPALETLIVNKAVGNLIRENKTFQIHSILQTGASQGMSLLDDSLCALIADGTVSREEARKHCDDPKRLGA